jgi:hypothetical protein
VDKVWLLPQICETKYNKTIPPHVFPSIDTYDLRLIRGRLQKKKVATAFLLEVLAAVFFFLLESVGGPIEKVYFSIEPGSLPI